MVEIVSDSVKVFSDSIMPAIQLEILEELENDTILLKVDGFELGEDQKYVANIIGSTFPRKDIVLGAEPTKSVETP